MQKLLHFYSSYRYEIIAALIGASIMILELVGARLIAPFFGTSIYVWTAVIGVILGAIALGEMIGGRWADASPSDKRLSHIIAGSALLLLFTQLIQYDVLVAVEGFGLDVRAEALIASLLLFAPVSFFLGVVSPYLAKLKLTSLKNVGQSVGTLYGAGTIGSILGTFLAGYFLLSYFGSRPLGLTMVAVLVLISFIASPESFRLRRIGLIFLALFFASLSNSPSGQVKHDTDSAYSRYQVVDVEVAEGQTMRQLRTDSYGVQSAIHIQDPDYLVATYNKLFFQAAMASDERDDVLMIGGGVFTFPSAFVDADKNATVDVVEIDPKLEEIAKNYFFYKDTSRIRIINEDGRVFLNNNQKKYDLIFMDAYTSLSPPFQLTTQEAVKKIADSVTDQGAVVVNLISAIEGERAEFLRSTFATYSQYFPHIRAYRTIDRDNEQRQNIVVYAAKDSARKSGILGTPLPDVSFVPAHILTDDYAPVERITQR